VVAQGRDETVRELPAERLLEALECRLLRSTVWSCKGRDVREDARRSLRSDLHEHGGTHGTGIGSSHAGDDPWRE
jgi:hypothetical protein